MNTLDGLTAAPTRTQSISPAQYVREPKSRRARRHDHTQRVQRFSRMLDRAAVREVRSELAAL